MVKQRQMKKKTNNNNNKRDTVSRPRKQLMRPGVPTTNVVRLPATFYRSGEVTSLRLKASLEIINYTVGKCKALICMSPTIFPNAFDYGLAQLFPLLGGMAVQHSKFMVTRLHIRSMLTTPTTSGGYIAIGFEPDDANLSKAPEELSDVSSALHADIAPVGEIAGFEVNVSGYHNDWKGTSPQSSSSIATHAGVVQVYATNAASLGAVVGLVQVEVDIHMTGFRSTATTSGS